MAKAKQKPAKSTSNPTAKKHPAAKPDSLPLADAAGSTSASIIANPVDSLLDATGSAEENSALLKLSRFCRADRIRINRTQLLNAPYNPRKITPTGSVNLRGSIQEFGLVQDPIWNARTGNIVGGHQRVNELDRLEGSPNYSLYVYRVDLDERQERNLNLVLNNLAAQGEHDKAKVVEMFRENQFDLDIVGWRPLDMELFALDAGLPSDYLDSMWSQPALDILDGVTGHINEVLDQSDELKRRKSEQQKQQGKNGSAISGSGSTSSAIGDTGTKQRKQSQDEDEDDLSDELDENRQDLADRESYLNRENSNDADSRYPASADPDRTSSNQSHTHTGNGQPHSPATLELLRKNAVANSEAQKFRDARRNLSEPMLAQRETDYFLTIACGSTDQKRALCDFLGIDSLEPFVDLYVIAERLGFNPPPLPKQTARPKSKTARDQSSENEPIENEADV